MGVFLTQLTIFPIHSYFRERPNTMATVNPQTFFRFAVDYYELLGELYQRRDGITEAELLQLVRRFATEGSPSASYLVDRLRELGSVVLSRKFF